MNYEKQYSLLINTRMCLKEKRIQLRKEENEYYEMHHVIPTSAGGTDASENLVLLTFKEHFMAHFLLFKDAQKTKDCKRIKAEYSSLLLLKSFCSKRSAKAKDYEKARLLYWKNYKPEYHHMYGGGKHSAKGLKSISDSRKGMMPVKDLITGKMIGMISCDHPKVLSGEWVHHSKGRKQSENEKTLKKIQTTGMNNPNAKPKITREYLLNFCIKNQESITHRTGYLSYKNVSDKFREEVLVEFGYKKVNLRVMIILRFGDERQFLQEFNKQTNKAVRLRYG